MKKNPPDTWKRPHCVKKFFQVMKLTLLFVMFFCFSASAFTQKVSISVKASMTLNEVLRQIKDQAGVRILYDAGKTKQVHCREMKIIDLNIADALKSVLKDTRFECFEEGGVYIVREMAQQQTKVIRVVGKVTDEKKQPLPGVTIQMKGLTVGTATDSKGFYQLSIPNAPKKFSLVYSFVGMLSQEIVYTGKDTINVVLKEDVETLDDVVVTGYQILKKNSVAGSVSMVKAEDLLLNGSLTLEQALQGKIAGLMVMNRSGLTGTRQRMRVRGTSTLLGNAEPVWVVDGVIQEDPLPFKSNEFNNLDMDNVDMIRNFVGGAVSWLNPNDIESVTVLKDASSTAIYGVKAANGVIVITTKKGQQGHMAVGYSGNFALTPRLNYDKMELMNSQERVDVSREAYERSLVLRGNQEIGYMSLALAYKRREISLEEFTRGARELESNNTDWFDLLFRNAFSHNHNVNISGGSAKTTYRASFGISEDNNSARGNTKTQYTMNMNMSTRLWDRVVLTGSLAGSVSETKGFVGIDPFGYANTTSRTIDCLDENGDLVFYRHQEGNYRFNILNELKQSGNENTLSSINTSLSIRWNILDGLAFNSSLSYSHSNSDGNSWYTEQSYYISKIRGYDYNEYGVGSTEYKNSFLPFGGEYNKTQNKNAVWSWRNQLDFTKVFNGLHSLSFMMGQEMKSSAMEGYSAQTYGYMHDNGRIFTQIPDLINGNQVNYLLKKAPTITDTKSNMMSFYMTMGYMYDNRYAFNASVRMDASNRFGQDKSTRYQPVWSFGLRWNLGSEPWLQGQDLLSDMSFRASYGLQGNVVESVSPDLIASIVASPTNGYDLIIKDLPAPYLKWEKVRSSNLGIDFSLFKRKIHGSFEYYYKKTTDMVVDQEVPYANGVQSRPINGGDMTNRGWDASVNFVPVRVKDLVVSLGFNFGKVYNEIKSTIEPVGSWQEATAGNLNKEGYPVSAFWAFRFKGLNPEHGGPEFDLAGIDEDQSVHDATVYMDHVGKMEPDLTTGMSISIRYKTLTLSSGLYVSVGNQQFLAPMSKNYTSIPSEYENMSTEWLKRWRKPGDEKNTNIPSLPDMASNARPITIDPGISGSLVRGMLYPYEMYACSDIRVVDAWYIRCNNISLSYTLPEAKLPKFIQNLSFSLNIGNPFQIRSKDFLGRDPEVALGEQPLSRSWSLGMNVSF